MHGGMEDLYFYFTLQFDSIMYVLDERKVVAKCIGIVVPIITDSFSSKFTTE